MSEEKVTKPTSSENEATADKDKVIEKPKAEKEEVKDTKSNIISPYDVQPGMIIKLFQKIFSIWFLNHLYHFILYSKITLTNMEWKKLT